MVSPPSHKTAAHGMSKGAVQGVDPPSLLRTQPTSSDEPNSSTACLGLPGLRGHRRATSHGTDSASTTDNPLAVHPDAGSHAQNELSSSISHFPAAGDSIAHAPLHAAHAALIMQVPQYNTADAYAGGDYNSSKVSPRFAATMCGRNHFNYTPPDITHATATLIPPTCTGNFQQTSLGAEAIPSTWRHAEQGAVAAAACNSKNVRALEKPYSPFAAAADEVTEATIVDAFDFGDSSCEEGGQSKGEAMPSDVEAAAGVTAR
jgi:hypothetical protein